MGSACRVPITIHLLVGRGRARKNSFLPEKAGALEISSLSSPFPYGPHQKCLGSVALCAPSLLRCERWAVDFLQADLLGQKDACPRQEMTPFKSAPAWILGGESRADVLVLIWGPPCLPTFPLPAAPWQGAELPLFQIPVVFALMVAWEYRISTNLLYLGSLAHVVPHTQPRTQTRVRERSLVRLPRVQPKISARASSCGNAAQEGLCLYLFALQRLSRPLPWFTTH